MPGTCSSQVLPLASFHISAADLRKVPGSPVTACIHAARRSSSSPDKSAGSAIKQGHVPSLEQTPSSGLPSVEAVAPGVPGWNGRVPPRCHNGVARRHPKRTGGQLGEQSTIAILITLLLLLLYFHVTVLLLCYYITTILLYNSYVAILLLFRSLGSLKPGLRLQAIDGNRSPLPVGLRTIINIIAIE